MLESGFNEFTMTCVNEFVSDSLRPVLEFSIQLLAYTLIGEWLIRCKFLLEFCRSSGLILLAENGFKKPSKESVTANYL
ncbi:hypothetical protein MNBD_GAMMA12-2466 [hydrothermal vent metagenome]|uniref:Uncharacterized protein n=1 Tax=hydrothermal vent metagenome TaxID=652676 RepID=A0A3B0Z2K0_9ZZZZ